MRRHGNRHRQRGSAFSANVDQRALGAGLGDQRRPTSTSSRTPPDRPARSWASWAASRPPSRSTTNRLTVSSVQGLIKAIQTNTKTNVLATPQIIALDNSEANFESRRKDSGSDAARPSGRGRLDVDHQGKRGPVDQDQAADQQDLELRQARYRGQNRRHLQHRPLPVGWRHRFSLPWTARPRPRWSCGDSDTVVLGGLIRDTISDIVTKIPMLGDIPVLGWLFKSHRTRRRHKDNLVVFMTPHIVRQYERVRAHPRQEAQGARRIHRDRTPAATILSAPSRDDMIRSLPDIKEITAKKPELRSLSTRTARGRAKPLRMAIRLPVAAASRLRAAVPAQRLPAPAPERRSRYRRCRPHRSNTGSNDTAWHPSPPPAAPGGAT